MATTYINLQKTGSYADGRDRQNAQKASDETRAIMKTLGEEIKSGSFRQLYLLYGEEGFLVKYYKNALKKAVIGDDQMNFTLFSGSNFNVDEFISIADTMPFFADRRLILVENSGIFQASRGGGARPESEKLAEYLAQLPETTTVIFAETGADKRFKLYKSFAKLGSICQFSYMDRPWIVNWTCVKAKRGGVLLTPKVADILVERIGVDLNILSNEIDKLVAYKGTGGEILEEDIKSLSTSRLEDRIFEMLTLLLTGKSAQAMNYYADLIGLREAPIKLIVIIGRQCAQVLGVLEGLASGKSDAEVASQCGMTSGRIYYIRQDYRGVSQEKLAMGMRLAAEMDYAIKSGNMEDRLALEVLMAKLAEK